MIRFVLVLIVFVLLVTCFCLCVNSARALDLSAECSVLIDATSGSVIYGKNEHNRATMASTTKIMTALILCELADLNEEITITDEMVRVEGSSMGLRSGDRAHYKDLLYGLILASGNDAANAIALSIGGSFDNFAKLMNDRAKQIGMSNTNFVTPSGLDDENHYSTAYDMAILAREAMKNQEFAKACSSEYAKLEYGNPPYKRTIKNHNKLLSMYDFCVGVKTGFTKKSGRCLVSCAENDGKRVIAVTLNAPDDWNDHIKMLDYGLSRLETRVVDCSLSLPKINVVGSTEKVSVYSKPTELSLLPDDFDKITYEVMLHDVLFAPIKADEVVGSVKLFVNNELIDEVDCFVSSYVSLKSVEVKQDLMFWFKRIFSA